MKFTPESGLRRILIALTLLAVPLVAVGGLTDRLWLLGLGIWALIAAFVIEMIYRP